LSCKPKLAAGLLSLGLIAAMLLPGAPARAAIVLQSTRVIFDASNNEATMVVRNDGQQEALIQSWMAAADDREETPFALVPPLARIPQQGTQLLRILFEGTGLPEDRESVAWLHVQDIPRTPSGDNVLQLAVRHAVKVFYRPRGLKGSPANAPRELTWRLIRDAQGAAIEVRNPSAYHVSMVGVRLGDGPAAPILADGQMVAPFASHRFPLDEAAAADGLDLHFVSINDYGGDDLFEVRLRADAPAQPSPAEKKAD
jgi:P pilus assembly chaperone PapD